MNQNSTTKKNWIDDFRFFFSFFAYPFVAADRGCGVWRPAQIFAAEVADNCLLHWFDTDLNRVLEIDGNMIKEKIK